MDTIDALRAECEALSRTLADLSDEDFAKPTRLPAWNVKELVAHLYRDVDRINVALSQPPPDAVTADSVSYWRSYDPAADGKDIAARSTELAAGYPTGHELARAWEEMWPTAVAEAERADRNRLIVTWGPGMTFEEFLRTRVLELAVHRMDLHAALGLPQEPTEGGSEITLRILRGLLRDDLPPGLWDEATFVEKATGRLPVTDEEAAALGKLSRSFPLLQ
jgi:uncharacterized protein (TIGR03083 family)